MSEFQSQAERTERAKAVGSLVGAAFIVPVVTALMILALWVMMAAFLTPGADAEGAYGSLERLTRFVLIAVGAALDVAACGIVVHRVTR